MTIHLVLLALNSVVRAAIAAIIVWKLVKRFHWLNLPERLGLCLVGGTSLLTIPPMLREEITPFDDWASLFFAGGLLIYLLGKLVRFSHEHSRGPRS